MTQKIELPSNVSIQANPPEIFEKIKKVFNVSWLNTVLSYGDKIYAKFIFSKDVFIHEEVHLAQQSKMDKDIWWERYLTDKQFRLDQEVEAYKVQAQWIQDNCSRNYKRIKLKTITMDLSSARYGNMISFKEAKKLIGIE